VAGKSVQIVLDTGWNLIGSKVALKVSEIFNDDQYLSVWKWHNNNWAVYLPSVEDKGAEYAQSKGFDVLTEIEPGEGFWVNAKDVATITITGTPASDTSLTISSGWNLMSLKVDEKRDISELISGKEDKILSIWKWENNNWAVYLPDAGQEATAKYAQSKGFEVLTEINPEEGFWINAKEELNLQ